MSKFNFDKVQRNIEKLKRDLPIVLANDAQRFFNSSFVKQGWDGVNWITPQRKIAGTNAYKYPKKGANARHTRATLVGSGKLRRTVAQSLVSKTFQSIKFIVNLPYAAVHNEGLPIKGGRMPQRKFMGDSETLRKLQREKINKAVKSVWQG
jgi:phage gpG-like protein